MSIQSELIKLNIGFILVYILHGHYAGHMCTRCDVIHEYMVQCDRYTDPWPRTLLNLVPLLTLHRLYSQIRRALCMCRGPLTVSVYSHILGDLIIVNL